MLALTNSEGKLWGQDCLYQLHGHGGIEMWIDHIHVEHLGLERQVLPQAL